MLLEALGLLLPTLWHSVLLERLYKGQYASSTEHVQFVAFPALACSACTLVFATVGSSFSSCGGGNATNNSHHRRSSFFSLCSVGALDALSLLALHQAFTQGTFQNILLLALALTAVAQWVSRLARASSTTTTLVSFSSSGLSVVLSFLAAAALVALGLGVYAFGRWSPPFGTYAVQPLTSAASVWTTLHVAASTVSSLLQSKAAPAADDADPEASSRVQRRWTPATTTTNPCASLAQSSCISTLICMLAAVWTYCFSVEDGQSVLLHDRQVQRDIGLVGLAFGLAAVFFNATYPPTSNQTAEENDVIRYAASQGLKLATIVGNAAVVGYARTIGPMGWLGIAWVAAGLALDVAATLNSPLASSGASPHLRRGFVQLPLSAAHPPTTEEKHALSTFGLSIPTLPLAHADEDEARDFFDQGHSHSHISDSDLPPPTSSRSLWLWSLLSIVVPLLLAGCLHQADQFLAPFDPHSNLRVFDAPTGPAVEGVGWAVSAHNALQPTCPQEVQTQRYERTHLHTALATWPRSGNSWTRMLIERASGFRTSTIYCDPTVEDVFLDDCNHEGKFLEKTHYPHLRDGGGWDRYARAVRPIRNPLDATYSFWHFRRSIDAGNKSHTARFALDHPLGQEPGEREEILSFARSWVLHDEYWSAAPIPSFVVRYEDLRQATLPNLMAMLSFFVPQQDLPSLSQVTCALELNESLQPYASAKREFFYSWDMLDPETRLEILETTKVPFCKHGFDTLFKEQVGETELPFECDQVRREVGPPEPRANP